MCVCVYVAVCVCVCRCVYVCIPKSNNNKYENLTKDESHKRSFKELKKLII